MNLLLDTQIIIWSQSEPKRLARRVARALEDSRNQRWISPASFWEIISLSRKGGIRIDTTAAIWFERTLERLPLQEATFTFEVAQELDSFRLPHLDPIDAILVATAKVYGLTLVTADRVLIESRACPVLANR